jgi:hypothetical protein
MRYFAYRTLNYHGESCMFVSANEGKEKEEMTKACCKPERDT